MASFTNVSGVWSDNLLRTISLTEEQIDAAVCVRVAARKDCEDPVTDFGIDRRFNLLKDNPDLAWRVNEFLAEEPKSRK